MNVGLNFQTGDIIGYIDRCEPFSGWILSTHKISALYLMLNGKYEKCASWIKRTDVINMIKRGSKTQYILDEKCGFEFNSLNISYLPAYWFLLVEHADGTLFRSQDFYARDIEKLYNFDLAPTIWETYMVTR